MERTRAFITAAAVGIVVLTGSVAMAANTGLLGFDGPTARVGQLDSNEISDLVAPTAGTDPASLPVVSYVDVFVTESTLANSAPGVTGPSDADPSASGTPLTEDVPPADSDADADNEVLGDDGEAAEDDGEEDERGRDAEDHDDHREGDDDDD